ncbi:hypothetical protein SK128_010517 [Halocaridina rubra]|uniref:Uncharacterized protein n=1 Tax=Halocaridina rubra TaxID=373956 RepID=A0AAN9AFL2_HALRR
MSDEEDYLEEMEGAHLGFIYLQMRAEQERRKDKIWGEGLAWRGQFFAPPGYTIRENGGRAMMEFYVNTLTSDSDSDNDTSSNSASTGSHEMEEEEEEEEENITLDRTYQIIGVDTVLDTIEEDVEEDSGAESSGHWMFSADNTDTDSVIHIPAISDLRQYPVQEVKESESTDSDSTLVVEDEVEVDGYKGSEVGENQEIHSNKANKGDCSHREEIEEEEEQEACVTGGNSHMEDNSHVDDQHTTAITTTTTTATTALGSSAYTSSSASEDNDSSSDDERSSHQRHYRFSQCTGLVNAGVAKAPSRTKTSTTRTRRRHKKDAQFEDDVLQGSNINRRPGPPPTRSGHHSNKMLSRTEAAKLFEKHIDDVFDFESLESCESVYGGSDIIGYSYPECISPLVGEETVVFNTSATSQPFADASTAGGRGGGGGGAEVIPQLTHERLIKGRDHVDYHGDAGRFNIDQRVGLTFKEEEEEEGEDREGGSGLLLPSYSHNNNNKPLSPIENHNISANESDDIKFINNNENGDLNATYIVHNGDGQEMKRTPARHVLTPAKQVLQHSTSTNKPYMTMATANGDDNDSDNDANDNHENVKKDSEEKSGIDTESIEPVSMDLFGLPVKWTDSDSKISKDNKNCDISNENTENINDKNTVSYNEKSRKSIETNIEALPDRDYINLDDDGETYQNSENGERCKNLTSENSSVKYNINSQDDDEGSHENDRVSHVSEYEKSATECEVTFCSLSSSSYSPSSTLAAAASETPREASHSKATTGNLLQSTTRRHQVLSAIPNVAEDGVAELQPPPADAESLQNTNGTATMRDVNISNPARNISHSSNLISECIINEPQIHSGQPHYVKPSQQRNRENFSSKYYEGEDIKSDDTTICQKRPSSILRGRGGEGGGSTGGGRSGQYQTDFPSDGSDTDTDNTDGDYDEEDHFAAELSLRISTVQSQVNRGGGKTFRNTDILNVLTATEGEDGAGREDATNNISPLASQEGSSPEMPDSLRSSEGRSATRSIETLSEDSGLGDRDVRLTPSSPLPSISENKNTHSRVANEVLQHTLLSSVTACPRRQDIRQARIAKARSCGDLRVFSDSDSDTEDSEMNVWHSYARGGPMTSDINGTIQNDATHTKFYKSTYANYLQQQYHGNGESNGCSKDPVSPDGHTVFPYSHHHHHSHGISGSDGSDDEVRSRYRRHNRDASSNHSKPRRHKSLLEFPWIENPYNTSKNKEFLYKESERASKRGVQENVLAPSNSSRFSRRRPQPISVDMAEEFISQEGLDSLTLNRNNNDVANNESMIKRDEKRSSWVPQHPPAIPALENGGVAKEVSCKFLTNQITSNELKTNGGREGGVILQSSGSWGDEEEEDLATRIDEVRADMRVQSGWPRAPTAPYPHHHHPFDALPHHQPSPSSSHMPPSSVRQPQHQYSSSTPAQQLPDKCQPVHTGHGGNSVPHVPIAHPDPSITSTQQPITQLQPSANYETTLEDEGGMAEVPIRVRTKTYGSHGEVEVYLARADSGRPPPHSASSPVLTPTGGTVDQRISGFRGVTFSPSVKEVNWRESYYYDVDPENEENKSEVNITTEEKTRKLSGEKQEENRVSAKPLDSRRPTPPPVVPVPTMPPQTTSRKMNGKGMEPSPGSSSEHESNDEKNTQQQKASSGPIWQRFKLPKISSPKSPRPRLLPKPKGLSSPKSSDTESSKPSSPTPESGGSSSTPSSPDSKVKKAPQSPKFFTWGSKREKKVREITRPTTAPPPVPQPTQVSGGQVTEGGEGKGAQLPSPGKPDSSTAVTLTDFNREGIGSADKNTSVKTSPVITSDSSENKSVKSALLKKYVRKSEGGAVNSSRGSSHNSSNSSGKEDIDRHVSPSVSSSGEDTSDTAKLSSTSSSSPRPGVAKPPLPPHLQRPTQQAFHKARLLSARRQYFSQERQVSVPERASPPKDDTDVRDSPRATPSTVIPAAVTTSAAPLSSQQPSQKKSSLPSPPPASVFDSSKSLKERFERFSASTRADRERLALSTPDLSVIEASVRRPNSRIDSWSGGGGGSVEQKADNIHLSTSPASASDGETSRPTNAHKGAPHTQTNPRQAIHERYKSRAQRIYARTRTQSVGVLETDLDTGASREVLTLRETNLDDLYKDLQHLLDTLPSVGTAPTPTDSKARAKSLLHLEAAGSAMEGQLETPARPPDTRAKSMEFLLDDGNKAAVQVNNSSLNK